MALRALTIEKWKQYLNELGIADPYAEEYAVTFNKHQVPKSLLRLMTDDELRDTYNIELGGHRLLIRNLNTATEAAPAVAVQSSSQSSHPLVHHQPPQLEPSMTPSSWRAFERHWKVYKGFVKIPSDCPDAAAHIFSLTCNKHTELRQIIEDHNVNHLLLPEDKYLEMLKGLLTAHATPETYRNKFFNMKQQEGENCRQWLKRLEEVVPDCEFYIQCDSQEGVVHKFDSTLVRSKFILGSYEQNVRQALLARASELPTLNQIFNYATQLEATSRDMCTIERSVARIKTDADIPSSSEEEEVAKLSSYRKMRKQPKAPRRQQQFKDCTGCGSNQHSNLERAAKCPAWNRNCKRCGKRGHFMSVCRSNKPAETANAVIASVSGTSKVTNNQIEAYITLLQGPKRNTTSKVMVLPDTGASICVAGLSTLKLLGAKVAQLQPTDRHIVTATGSTIRCKGRISIKICIQSMDTELDLFICEKIGRFYLSKDACIQLGIIHKDFPRPLVMSTHKSHTDVINNSDTGVTSVPERPSKIPFEPIPQNIPLLKKYLLEAFSNSSFNNDKTTIFPKMLGVPKARIHLKPDARPYFRATPNQVPHHWRIATKKLLDEHVQRGIIAKTPIGTPTPWCFPMVVTPKKSNTLNPKLRMTIDLQNLNSQCIRELHHVESPFNLATQIPPNTYKTILDAVDGYQAVELHEDSQPLTTFITHWGSYHYLRVPAGLVDSGDKYTSRYDKIIQHIPRKLKCVDDTLLYDTTIEDAFYHTFDYLATCASHGVVLNASKFQFCEKEVNFAGFKVTTTGIQPSDPILQAIREFPVPRSVTDVRSWFGLVRQVAYAHSVSDSLAPFRELLKHSEGKKPSFFWTPELQQIFERSKSHLVEAVKKGIKTFDCKRWTCIQCDWSKQGIGFLILQKHCSCPEPSPSSQISSELCCNSGWKLVYAGSRFTNNAESRYAPTEGEALAVAWALKTARLYTLGCPKLLIVTDHKPLLGIFNDRDLGSIKNPRVRRIKESTLEYRFQIQHCPGKLHLGADALSRYPAPQSRQSAKSAEEVAHMYEQETEAILHQVVANISTTDDSNPQYAGVITLDKVELECMKDPDYQQLLELVLSGFPNKREDTPSSCKTYWPLAQKGSLTTYGNVVMYNECIVIPKSLRTLIIQILHSAHQGCNGMIARAGTTVYWPGIRKDILSYQTNCRTCLENSPSHPREPLQMTPIPERPFQVICTDFFQLAGRHYLVVVDRFSGFMHLYHSRVPPSHKFLINNLRDVFVRYGRPERLESDGGPQYQSLPFKDFLRKWGAEHRVSSPYYPQSNGRAELAVKSAKRMLRDNVGPNGELNTDRVARAVLNYHNTPLPNSPLSPAQLLFGRPLADFLPVNPRAYQLHPHWKQEIQKHQMVKSQHHADLASRWNRGTRHLKPLAVGQEVALQSPTTKRWNRTGRIIEKLPHRRYSIRLNDNRNITIRNRRFLKLNPLSRTKYYGPLRGPASNQEVSSHQPTQDRTPERRGADQQHTADQTTSSRNVALQHYPEVEEVDVPNHPKEPLALRRLRPFNLPGLKEQ